MRSASRVLWAAIAVGLAAFAFRFLTQGALENDHFVILARAHQMLHGDLPVRDFEDPGMPGAYLLSAAAARLMGPTLLTDTVLCITLLAIAAGLTYALTLRASGSAIVALGAVAIQVALQPRLYNATKVLVPVVAIALAWRGAQSRTRAWVVALAAWTAVAFMVRHDFALYVGIATLASMAAAPPHLAASRRRDAVLYVLISALAVAPWLAYVQWAVGLRPYIVSSLYFAAAEAQRTAAHWPVFGPGDLLSSIVFYTLLTLPLIALSLARRSATVRHADIVFAAVLTFVIEVVFLRGDLPTRIPDVAGPMVVLIAWLIGTAVPRRGVVIVGGAILAIAGGCAAASFGTGTYDVPTPSDAVRRVSAIAQALRSGETQDTAGSLAMLSVAYLESCTAPADRVLVAGFGPDIPVLAHRAFAGGVPDWLPGYYTAAADAGRALARLDREQPTVAILLEGSGPFVSSWPSAAAWLASKGFQAFRPSAGHVPEFWVRRPDVSRTDPHTGIPCPGGA